jgi:hypothetical protein
MTQTTKKAWKALATVRKEILDALAELGVETVDVVPFDPKAPGTLAETRAVAMTDGGRFDFSVYPNRVAGRFATTEWGHVAAWVSPNGKWGHRAPDPLPRDFELEYARDYAAEVVRDLRNIGARKWEPEPVDLRMEEADRRTLDEWRSLEASGKALTVIGFDREAAAVEASESVVDADGNKPDWLAQSVLRSFRNMSDIEAYFGIKRIRALVAEENERLPPDHTHALQ